MEQFTTITERAPTPCLAPGSQTSRNPSRAPLYASPWVALFVFLRNEFRQPRTLEN